MNWMKLNCVVPLGLWHPQRWVGSRSARSEKSSMTLVGFEPTTFRNAINEKGTGPVKQARKHVALRSRKRDGLLGTGKREEESGKERVARPSAPIPKDRGGRGPPPEQQLC